MLVDGVSGADHRYTFTNVRRTTRSPPRSRSTNYTITATAGAGGSISPGGAGHVACGADQTFTITPDDSYHVDPDVLVDGVSSGPSPPTRSPTCRRTTPSTPASRSSLHDHGVGRGGRLDQPSGALSVACGADRLHHHSRCRATRSLTCWWTACRSGRWHLHVHQRAGEPHDRRRASRSTDLHGDGFGRPGRLDQPERRGLGRVRRRVRRSRSRPAPCYHVIADVLVDGVSVGAGDELHVHQRAGEPHDRRDASRMSTYTVTASAGPGGSITPERRGHGRLRRRPDVHDHADACYHDRRRSGGRRVGRCR